MTRRTITATITALQKLLDRDYGQFEWRVMLDPDAGDTPALVIHARTRDYQTRCRIARRLPDATDGQSLRSFAARIVAEAEPQLVGDRRDPAD